MDVLPHKIPQALKARNSWVLWRHVERDGKPTKVPFTPEETPAKSTDPSTWSCFDMAFDEYERRPQFWEGIGFVFSESDPFVGIDLDACYHDKIIDPWAKKIITDFDTYAELSPSGNGIKLIVEGKFPLSAGKNKKLDLPQVEGKTPGIECYDSKRFFTVTGQRFIGPSEPQPRQDALDEFCSTHWKAEMTVARAMKYVERMPAAITGQGGDRQTYRVACCLVKGFLLSEQDALLVMREYNRRCQPCWSEKELQRKLQCAQRDSGASGYLAEAKPADWDKIVIPEYDTADVGRASRMCIEVLDGLEVRERRFVLSGLQALYR